MSLHVKKVFIFQALFVCQYSYALNWTEIPFDRAAVVVQRENSLDCGPAAIFNSHSLGKPVMKAVIQLFSGDKVEDKFESFLKKIAHKPSEFNRGTVSRTHRLGTNLPDFRFILADLFQFSQADAPFFRGGYLHRRDFELNLLERVHTDLNASIEQSVPPVIVWSKYHNFERRYAHAVTVVGVSGIEVGQHDWSHFWIKYFDPLEGKVLKARVGDWRWEFPAYTWEIYERPGQIVRPKASRGQKFRSPFLVFYSEDTETRFERPFTEQETRQDLYSILEGGFGDFFRIFEESF